MYRIQQLRTANFAVHLSASQTVPILEDGPNHTPALSMSQRTTAQARRL